MNRPVDPLGKRGLFSAPIADDEPRRALPGEDAPAVAETPAPEPAPSPEPATAAAPQAAPEPEPEPAPAPAPAPAGTLVIECSECGESTRLGYLDFALLHLPVALWLPIPGRRYTRRITCPECGRWAWVRTRWFD